MKHHAHLRRIVAVAVLLVVALPGSLVQADGHGGGKSVRGGGTTSETDENWHQDDPNHQQGQIYQREQQDPVEAEVVHTIRGGGHGTTVEQQEGASREAEAEDATGGKIVEGRYLKQKKDEGLFVPPDIEGGNDRTNNAFGHINKNKKFKPKKASEEAIEGQWIVVLSDDTEDWDVDFMMSKKAKDFHGRSKKSFKKLLKGGVIDGMSAADAYRLSEDPGVLLVEQDSMVHAYQSWGQDRMDQRSLPLDGIYDAPNDGAGVTAYVFDTWVRTSHTEFQGRASVGEDFTDESCDSSDSSHGTHVAGTIGGKTYGIAPGVNIVSLVVLGCGGSGSWSWSVDAMEWAANHCETTGGPCVANLSLGGGKSNTANAAAKKLWESGVFVTVAAGNENTGSACTESSFASADDVCVVGSTDSNDGRSSFSNYGECVDIFAPGGSIWSSVSSSDDAFGTKSGTSMSSPHIAGLAALHLNANPNLTPLEVLDAIVADATPDVVGNKGSGSPNRLAYADSIRLGCTPPCGAHEICSSGNNCVCEPGWEGPTCETFIHNVCGNSVCESSSSETSSSCPQDCAFELITTISGGVSSYANMFDINVKGSDNVVIDQIDINCKVAGTNNVEIHYRPGTYQGFETNAAAWVQLFNSAVDCESPGESTDSFTSVVLPVPVEISAGSYAFFVWVEQGIVYTRGIEEGLLYPGPGNHPHLDFFEGIGMSDKFSGSTYSPRVWNGRIQYTTVPPCANDLDCNDFNPCTNDVCVESVCQRNNLDDTSCSTGSTEGVCSGGTCVECLTDGDCSSPRPFCNGNTCTACTLPTSNEWFIITNDGCTDGRSFGTNEDITIIYHNAAIDHGSVGKIECEFKVLGAKDRKTKFKLDSAADLRMNNPSFPRYHSSDNTYRITIRMDDIGRIGGWDGGYTSDPNNPIAVGEWTSYKLKIDGEHDFAQGSDLKAVTAVANDHPCVTDSTLCVTDDLCTDDSCDPVLGCVSTPVDCSHLSNTCREGVCDSASGACVATTTDDCDDGNSCTTDTCDPVLGCVYDLQTHEGVLCDDGDNCTTGDKCFAGVCTGALPTCDDGNACTDDNFDSSTCQCVYTNNMLPCSDGDFCTLGDVCFEGSCQPGTTTVDCSDLSNTCQVGVCHSSSGTCVAKATNNGGACDDGNACTLDDKCDSGICQSGTTNDCDDGDACTTDTCDPSSGCVNTPMPCDNALFCDGVETCSEGKCSSSGNPCQQEGDFCDEGGDRCVECLHDANCPSGEVCNAAGACVSACSLPNKSTWLVIGRNNPQPCSEIRTVDLDDSATMIFFHKDITNANNLAKLEVEFKVEGDKDRKTKWRIQSNFFDETDSNGQGRPHAFYDGSVLRFRLDIDVGLIGDIGGTEGPDNKPVKRGEMIEWKWKVEAGSKVQLDSDDNISEGVINVV